MSGIVGRAEHALLGAVMLRPAQLPSLRWVTPADFSAPAHGWLWNRLHRMDPARIDPVAVTQALADADPGTRQILAPHRLAGMVDACPTPAHAPLYAGMVLESALHRTVDFVGSDLRTRAAHGLPDEVDQLVGEAVATGQQLSGLGVRWATVPETVRSLLDTGSDQPPAPAPALVRSRVDPLAEQAVVSSLLRYPQQMDEVGRWLHAADFAESDNATVYRAVERLAQRRAPVDPLTVAWEAQRASGALLDPAWLTRLDHDAAPGQAEYAGRAVLGASALDRLNHAGAHVAQLAADTSLSVPALLTQAGGAIAPLAATHQRLLAVDTPAHTTAAPDQPRTEMEIDL